MAGTKPPHATWGLCNGWGRQQAPPPPVRQQVVWLYPLHIARTTLILEQQPALFLHLLEPQNLAVPCSGSAAQIKFCDLGLGMKAIL